MSEETWKDIKGYEGIYQVSSLGRVRSLDHVVNTTDTRGCKHSYHRKGRMLSISRNGNRGYLGVSLKGGRQYVHRMVALAFIPNPDNLQEVNHRDENKANNRADNLEWCDRLYNINYGTGRERHRENLYTRRPILMLDKEGKVLAEFSSIREAERKTGINRSPIANCCKRKDKYYTAGGYKWEFAENRDTPDQRIKPPKYIPPIKKRAVVMLDENGNALRTFDSVKEAEEYIGVTGVIGCCKGQHHITAGGYRWRYADEQTKT